MFSLLISIISIFLVLMLTIVSVTAGGGVDFGTVVLFLGGMVLGIGLVVGFFWLLYKAFDGIPNFWSKNTKEISIGKNSDV